MFCTNCGTSLPEDASRCPACGYRTETDLPGESLSPSPTHKPSRSRRKRSKLIFLLFVSALVVFCAVCVLATLSPESKGVPDSYVLRHNSITRNPDSDYKITHNIDKDTHIDEVEFTTTSEGMYGTLTKTQVLQFQYDKASDLWEFLGIIPQNGEYVQDEQTLNDVLFIHRSPFVGSSENESYTYSITFSEIDFTMLTATFTYTIDHKNDEYDISGSMTSDINASGYEGEYKFSIPYECTVPTLFSVSGYKTETRYYTFQLDYNGLSPA